MLSANAKKEASSGSETSESPSASNKKTFMTTAKSWNFDIDRYLNPIVPAPRWHLVPSPIARVLGYRRPEQKVPQLGNMAKMVWAFIGIFIAILLVELASRNIGWFEANGTLIVASFGAAAVLEFYTIESPLAQPRNAVFGQIISVIVGVCVSKLFRMSPHYESVRFVGGALACAAATVCMALTKTVHPPAGATALLAVVDMNAANMGWALIPMVMLGCAVMVTVALLVNNIQSRYPTYWWTPEPLKRKMPVGGVKEEGPEDVEAQSAVTLEEEEEDGDGVPVIVLRKGRLIVRGRVSFSMEERTLLESISERL